MNLPMRDEPWPVGQHQSRPCPICGKSWTPWAGSKLPCHAACLFTPQERQAIRAVSMTQTEIARAWSVSPSTIRSILNTKE